MSPDRAIRDRHPSAGFTLIELMVVVLIIGILIGLVVTVIPKVKKAVYGAETQNELSVLSNAIQQYYNDFKAYPGPLANNQIGAGWDKSGNSATPLIYYGGNSLPLMAMSSGPFVNVLYNPVSPFPSGHISGAQNLTLGLLGGLELTYAANTQNVNGFIYNPQDIFSDGVTLAPRGAAGLNPNAPHRYQPYMQVKPGDLSIPNLNYNGGTGSSFADSAGRSPNPSTATPSAPDGVSGDAMIPVFLDKYADPLPILYYRATIGAQAIAGFRHEADDGGVQLTDSVLGTSVTAQYAIQDAIDFTNSLIGTNASSPATNHHGLRGVDAAGSAEFALTDTITAGFANSGKNGVAYFQDPSTTNAPSSASVTNTHQGVARQKDGYILITAGPDRLYGTTDDIVFPGPLLPSN